MPITIVIADDHMLLRQGIKNVLELEADIKVVGEAADGEEALRVTQECKPDVLLLDINMPRLNGLEVTKQLRMSPAKTKVIVLTINDDETYVMEIIKAGAAGYLLKDIEPGMLVQAIRSVCKGDTFIYPTLANRLFGEMKRQREEELHTLATLRDKRREERLTYREIDVLQLVCKGMSNQEVASQLFLSEKTVKNHLTNIFRKLNVSDRTQAVLYAIKNKIVLLD